MGKEASMLIGIILMALGLFSRYYYRIKAEFFIEQFPLLREAFPNDSLGELLIKAKRLGVSPPDSVILLKNLGLPLFLVGLVILGVAGALNVN